MPGRRDLRIVYEDDCLIVADKPYGLLTMSAGRDGETTAYSILTDYVRSNSGRNWNRARGNRIFIVHRLDRETSGLLIFAKDPQTKYALQDNWQEVVLERNYVAVTEGCPRLRSGTVSSVLRENPATHAVYSARGTVSVSESDRSGKDYKSPNMNPAERPQRMNSAEQPSKNPADLSTRKNYADFPQRMNSADGKQAVTHFKVLAGSRQYSLVQFALETGRKNQIRVHAADMGCPIAGDRKYGARTSPLGRVALHARSISFIHPATGETLRFDTGIPRAFKALFK